MKHILRLVIASIFVSTTLQGCALTSIIKPPISSTFKDIAITLLDRCGQLNAMVQNGGKVDDFKNQLAQVRASLDLAEAKGLSTYAPIAGGKLANAVHGWQLYIDTAGQKFEMTGSQIGDDLVKFITAANKSYPDEDFFYTVWIAGDYIFMDNAKVVLALFSEKYYTEARYEIMNLFP